MSSAKEADVEPDPEPEPEPAPQAASRESIEAKCRHIRRNYRFFYGGLMGLAYYESDSE